MVQKDGFDMWHKWKVSRPYQNENDEIKYLERMQLNFATANWDIEYILYHRPAIYEDYDGKEKSMKYDFN